MEYPKEVQEKLDILNAYTTDETLMEFHILHMYPGELCYPNGYYDSRFFELVGYNTDEMTVRELGEHDAIRFHQPGELTASHVFADGSHAMVFGTAVTLSDPFGQALYFNNE